MNSNFGLCSTGINHFNINRVRLDSNKSHFSPGQLAVKNGKGAGRMETGRERREWTVLSLRGPGREVDCSPGFAEQVEVSQ